MVRCGADKGPPFRNSEELVVVIKTFLETKMKAKLAEKKLAGFLVRKPTNIFRPLSGHCRSPPKWQRRSQRTPRGLRTPTRRSGSMWWT
jgi:hypothetical protein